MPGPTPITFLYMDVGVEQPFYDVRLFHYCLKKYENDLAYRQHNHSQGFFEKEFLSFQTLAL